MYTDSSIQLSFDLSTHNDQVVSTLQVYLRDFGNFSNLGKLPVIKQQTPNDCGPYILMYMQRFVHLASSSDNFQETMSQVQGYVDYDAFEMRKQVLNLIGTTHPTPFAILAVSIVNECFSNSTQAHSTPTVISSPDETRQVPLTTPHQLIDSNRTRRTRKSRKYPPKKKKFSQKYQIIQHQHRGILTQSRPRPILLRSDQIDTLKPNVLLHDSVIDFVGQYIVEKSNRCEFFEVANIQDAINLSQYNIMFEQFREVQLSMEKSSKRHTKKCKKRFLFIPIHDGLFDTTATHWSLLICDIQNKQYFSIDSMCTEDQHSQFSNTLSRIDNVISQLQQFLFDMANFSYIARVPVQQVQTLNDCGPFILMYMNKFVECESTSTNLFEILSKVSNCVAYNALEMRKQILSQIVTTHPDEDHPDEYRQYVCTHAQGEFYSDEIESPVNQPVQCQSESSTPETMLDDSSYKETVSKLTYQNFPKSLPGNLSNRKRNVF
ncbi:hypothetical protein GEMRC1_006343 [Eukaryota sp. GEM-RC1]